MKGRFLIFGFVLSALVHAVILSALSFSAGGGAPTEGGVPAAPRPPQPQPQPQPEPARSNPTRPVTLPSAHATPAHEPAPTPEVEWVTYTVRKGDMLERLVKRAGCSISEVARYNKTTVKKISNLKVGQRIKLPKFKEN